MRRTVQLIGPIATLLTALVACSNGSSSATSPAPGIATPPASSTFSGSGTPVVTMTCADSTHEPPISANAGSLKLGPVTFVGAKTLSGMPAPKSPPPGKGTFTGVFVVVTGKNPATVSIGPDASSPAALWYVPASERRQDKTTIATDPSSVDFKPCSASTTWFSGGFVTSGAQCVPVDVSSGGSTESGQIGFATSC